VVVCADRGAIAENINSAAESFMPFMLHAQRFKLPPAGRNANPAAKVLLKLAELESPPENPRSGIHLCRLREKHFAALLG
jgi:hypothetical protein